MADTVLSLSNVGLTLAGNAGPVTILRDITLDIVRGQTGWDGRAIGVWQIVSPDAYGRAGNARQKAGSLPWATI